MEIQAFIIPSDKQHHFPIELGHYIRIRLFKDNRGRDCVPVKILGSSTIENLFNAMVANEKDPSDEFTAWADSMVELWQWAATQTPVTTTIPNYEEQE